MTTITQTSRDPSPVQLKEGIHTNSPTKKVTEVNNHWSLISLNVNGVNLPIKRHRLKDWIGKQDPRFCCLQETHLNHKDRYYLRVKNWENIFQSNARKKQVGIAILISN